MPGSADSKKKGSTPLNFYPHTRSSAATSEDTAPTEDEPNHIGLISNSGNESDEQNLINLDSPDNIDVIVHVQQDEILNNQPIVAVNDNIEPENLINNIETNTDLDIMASGGVSLPKFYDEFNNIPVEWWYLFESFKIYHNLQDDRALASLAFNFDGQAKIWLQSLAPEVRNDMAALKAAFLLRFSNNKSNKLIYKLQQLPGENGNDYLTRVQRLAMNTELGESTIVELALNGLLPHLKASVTQSDPKTYNELRQAIDIAINVTECHNHSIPSTKSNNVPQVPATTENPATASSSNDINSLLSSFIDSMKTVVRQEVMALTPNRDNREERQFSQVPCRGCGALSYATVFSWILLVGIYAVNADGEVQMHRINYGVTFAKEANIVFGSENWLHTFEIPLPHKISSVQFPRCDIVHQNCHILNQVISQLSAVRTGVTGNINNTIDVIHRLVKKADFNLDTRSQSRSKRGLFDFIGSISRSLFGTATVKDVQKLARHINILAERNNKFAKAMSHHDEELSSFMTNTDSRFSNMMRGIQKNYDSIQNVTFETAKFVAHFEDVSLKLSNLFIDQMNDSSVITKYLEELNIGIHEMVKGKLSPFLISPNILNNAMKHIKLILSDKFKGFYLLKSDPAYYYSECSMLFARKHSTLYLTLKFPISTFAFPLYLYKITSYPVPVNVTSTHATQILDLPEYFVVTHNNQYYASLSFDKLRSCSGTNTLYCSHSLPLVSAVKTNCISSLYINSKSDIHKQCDFRFLLNAIQPSIEQIFDNTLLVYKTNTLAFECQNKHSIVKGCHFCFIHIPCRCSLSTDSIFVPKKIEHCQNNTDTITVLHPVNLALIQHFFSHETYNSILGDTVFTKPINIDIPKIHIFNHTFSNILAQDKILHLSLKRIAKATQKERTVFTSLSEPLLDGKITVDNSWLDLSTILAIAALGLSSILAIVCFTLVNKVRILTATVLLLQKIPQAQSTSIASTIPTFIYKQISKTTTPSTIENIFNTQCNPWPFVILSIITTITLTIFTVYFYKRSTNNNHTKVVLEITNGLSCITIPIVKLSLCPTDWDIKVPDTITNMRISGFFITRLHADWHDFCIRGTNTKHEIPLPKYISINPYTARKIRKILNTPFFCHILLTHHNHFMILK
ncbi:uncharacterized protein LOC127720584 [Mytilus californianus]|uniref:uncharacterized protein LOC127720584 n=1 Tax=Mytilus californianus TaxID=6549 RepID=UPI00224725AA|nr:uncharacterized protein LOC127720584 [Mytilus californianus]